MKADLTTKTLLGLILVALGVLLVRQQAVPVYAQSAAHASTQPVAIAIDSSIKYVVANGYLSAWQLEGGYGTVKSHLVLLDAKRLPQ